MLKLLLFTVFCIQLIKPVIFRYQPPFPMKNTEQAIQGEKNNIVRRRFKNEAPMQTSKTSFCSKYQSRNNKCSQCYQGFLLQDNNCIVDPNFNPEKKWNQLSFMKISSPSKVHQDLNKILLNINPFCSSLTPDGALCLSCYKTHKLENGNCIEKQDQLNLAEQLYLRPFQVPKNTFCKTFDSNGDCTSCFPESTFNGSQCVIIPRPDLDCRLHQYCLPKSTECKTYSSQGVCKSCPFDAININGVCRINKPQSLCVQIGANQKCKKCSPLGYLHDGICKFKTPNCLQYNSDNITCNTCLPTYRRQNGQCIRISKNCATWKQGLCIQCKYGFGFYQKYCFNLQQLKSKGITPQNSVQV